MRKICVVTGSRADYGLLRWVMEGIHNSSKLELQIIATGMHLSPEFGLTYREIEKDGFCINGKVEMLLSADTPSSICRSMGLALISFPDVLRELKPDMLLVLGDRYEIFSAATAAMVSCIPIVHLHGGEVTEGVIDESIRHSITKMAQLHFVATDEYKKRVIQLGEQPNLVFQVGGLGIDNIVKLDLLGREELEKELNFQLGKKNLLITFHPVTLEEKTSKKQMSELLLALDKLKETHLLFTMPNADTDSRILFRMIEDFVEKRKHAKAFISLGYLHYLSCIKHSDGVVGNSSSGLIEVPTFKKGTINIGDRQKGRIKAESVIDCEPKHEDISKSIEELFSQSFRKNLEKVVNPYGKGGASMMIVKILEETEMCNLIKKKFYDQ